SAFATLACFQQSPRFVQQADQYWQINTVPSGPLAGKPALLKQAEPFAGRINGSVQRQECSGAEAKPLIKTSKASVKGTLSVEGDAVKLILSVTDLKDKIVKEERLEFLGHSPTVNFTAGAAGEFALIQKLRANAKPGDKISLLRESEYSLTFTKKFLTIRAVHFANGLAYAEDVWEITPR
ncbi:MAG TPA: hypothetical protein PKZ52_12290, partial [Cellvibrionaceae bacterium]|nr:hypothetical protein [Cellvibrionaceae bacterium]